MPFINEFVSEQDIEKYHLIKIWDRYHPLSTNDMNKIFRHSWTIDRKRGIFIMPIKYGREEFSNQITWILWWRGNELTATLLKSGWENTRDGEGLATWELQNIWKPQGCTLNNETILPVLKEALTEYGFLGIQMQLPNFIVEFRL